MVRSRCVSFFLRVLISLLLAWPVNFTASLASLEPSIRSVRVLVDFALRSPLSQPPRLLFLSSIGLFFSEFIILR